MKIQILIDNPNSWIIPYAKELQESIAKKLGFKASLLHKHDQVEEGDLLVMLSCEQIFKKLNLNKHNLVVHESALPQGKGWSPLTWQVLEGKQEIPITLFEAADAVDAGEIYETKYFKLEGTELVEDLRKIQGEGTAELVLRFLTNYPNVKGFPQEGEESFYPRRGPKDSMLDINKSIEEQFNLLRVCDNERYPAFFEYKGVKYKIKIEKYV